MRDGGDSIRDDENGAERFRFRFRRENPFSTRPAREAKRHPVVCCRPKPSRRETAFCGLIDRERELCVVLRVWAFVKNLVGVQSEDRRGGGVGRLTFYTSVRFGGDKWRRVKNNSPVVASETSDNGETLIRRALKNTDVCETQEPYRFFNNLNKLVCCVKNTIHSTSSAAWMKTATESSLEGFMSFDRCERKD